MSNVMYVSDYSIHTEYLELTFQSKYKNFYKSVEIPYPDLNDRLKSWGFDRIDHPEDLMGHNVDIEIGSKSDGYSIKSIRKLTLVDEVTPFCSYREYEIIRLKKEYEKDKKIWDLAYWPYSGKCLSYDDYELDVHKKLKTIERLPVLNKNLKFSTLNAGRVCLFECSSTTFNHILNYIFYHHVKDFKVVTKTEIMDLINNHTQNGSAYNQFQYGEFLAIQCESDVISNNEYNHINEIIYRRLYQNDKRRTFLCIPGYMHKKESTTSIEIDKLIAQGIVKVASPSNFFGERVDISTKKEENEKTHH